MVDRKQKTGRPKSDGNKRHKFHNVRFTEDEFKNFENLAKELNLSKTELIRIRVLENAKNLVTNSRELLNYLDGIGSEMGRIGNNINQLARHANVLKLQGTLHPTVVKHFETLLDDYIKIQRQLEISLRKIIRLMGK